MIELAVIDIANSSFAQAKQTLDEVSKLNFDAKSELRFYDVMTYYFEESGDFKQALEWRNKYISFYRRNINETQTKNIQNLSVLYETERKNLEIDAQKLKIDVQEQRLRFKNGQLIFLAAGVLAILVLTYVSIQGIRRRNKIEKLQARFDGEKSIKASIGKNLHDFVAPELHAARMKLELLQLKGGAPEINPIVQQLQESTENIRSMSHQLSPMIYRLEVTTFRRIVQNALIEFERYANIVVEVKGSFPERLDDLPEEDQENIYGIILEGLNNVRRHSKALALTFSITEADNEFALSLIDDGIGIHATNQTGIGIQNMKSRADLLKGKLSFETLEKGSELSLLFPKRQQRIKKDI